MKINLKILLVAFLSFLLSQENDFPIKEFNENGKLDALIDNYDERLYLVQINAINDSLVHHVLNILPNLDLNAGASSYHRLLNENQFLELSDHLNKESYLVLDDDYQMPNNRNYWTLTLQGSQYNSTSGETNGCCMCLDSSDCVVVGYNDSWYDPFDYYGEVSWSFVPPDFDEILEVRVYISGAQCDDLPLWSETTMSVKNNSCSWSDFQATLSESNTVNGPYILPDSVLEQIWCEGSIQPIIGSEDNYNVDWVQLEIYYTCETENSPDNFQASSNEYCDYIQLDWENNINADGYNLYRDGDFILQFSQGETQYIDYFAQDNTEHQYCITSLSGCGESEQSCTFGSRKIDPESSPYINASSEYLDYIEITWEESLDTEFYYLYRDGSLLTIIPAQQELYYQDVFVSYGESYEYCVESTNECGESDLACDIGSPAIGYLGDINLDQEIDVLDIVILLNFVLELNIPSPNELWSSDINQDGVLNVLDVVILVNLILNTN